MFLLGLLHINHTLIEWSIMWLLKAKLFLIIEKGKLIVYNVVQLNYDLLCGLLPKAEYLITTNYLILFNYHDYPHYHQVSFVFVPDRKSTKSN